MANRIFFISFIVVSLISTSIMVAAKTTTQGAMRINNQEAKNWNQFADNLYLYHKYLISTHDVRTEEKTGGYAGLPDFYREISYYDNETDRLLSRIQWETKKFDQVHVIEVYLYDESGNLKSDYLAAYLPEYRNAPIQTLINLHYKNDELKSFRQFDASGAKIYERCEGKFFGKPLSISLDEDEFYSSDTATIKLLGSEEYLACFERTPHIAAPYLSPLKIGDVPETFITANAEKQQERELSYDDVSAQIQKLSRLIKESSNPAPLLIERGRAYFKLHEFEKAVKDYNKALSLNDALDEAYFGRGMAKGRLGLIKQGIADLTVYIGRKPESTRAYTKRGVRYIWAGELDKAKKDLTMAIKLDPGNAEAHDDLGVVNASKGNYQTAISLFKQVIEIDPTYQKGFHNLAMSYHIVGEKQKALQHINSALAISPKDKNSLLLKGEILKALGLKQEAQAIIEQAEFLPDGNWSERFSMQHH